MIKSFTSKVATEIAVQKDVAELQRKTDANRKVTEEEKIQFQIRNAQLFETLNEYIVSMYNELGSKGVRAALANIERHGRNMTDRYIDSVDEHDTDRNFIFELQQEIGLLEKQKRTLEKQLELMKEDNNK